MKTVSSGSPASGTRRSVHARKSTSSMQPSPPTIRTGSTPGASSGTGGAYWLALSTASPNVATSSVHAVPTGSGDPVRSHDVTTPVDTTWASTTTAAGARQ